MLEQSRGNLRKAIVAVERAHSELATVEGTRPIRDALQAMREDLVGLAGQLEDLVGDRYGLTAAGEQFLQERALCSPRIS